MNDTTQQPMTGADYAELERKFPDSELVKRYRDIGDFIDAENAAQSEHLKPHIANQTAIAGELHRRLLARNPNWQPGVPANTKTEHGTAFLKSNESITVKDRDAFFQFLCTPAPGTLGPIVQADNALVQAVCTAILEKLRNFATAHVAKEGVESYLDQILEYRKQHGGALPPGVTSELPPGINLERFTKLQVRKA